MPNRRLCVHLEEISTATQAYAAAALKNAAIDRPEAFVAAEDVSAGKPR